jgi:hypothetical protein
MGYRQEVTSTTWERKRTFRAVSDEQDKYNIAETLAENKIHNN